MNASELRIGNLTWDVEQNEVYKIVGIEEKRVSVEGSTFTYTPIDKILPIELTEEWLIKSECEKKGLYYIKDRFKLFWKSKYKFWYIFDNESAVYLTKVEFVHEWQNFYHIMNGEELKIS